MTPIIRKLIVAASCLALVPVGAQAKSKSSKDEAQVVQCKDGTTSKAGRGACSHHGGVASESTADQKTGKAAASAKSAASEASEASEVRCKDGTTSKAGRGACSHHGGVAANTPREETKQSGPSGSEQSRPQSESRAAPQGRAPATVPQRTPPTGQPTARCKDGTLSYSQHRSGTCSRHGGVAEWLSQ